MFYSLVPRPSLTASFAAVAKSVVFATAVKKAVREGLGTRLGVLRITTTFFVELARCARSVRIEVKDVICM